MLDYHPYLTSLFVFSAGYTVGLISAYILTVDLKSRFSKLFGRK